MKGITVYTIQINNIKVCRINNKFKQNNKKKNRPLSVHYIPARLVYKICLEIQHCVQCTGEKEATNTMQSIYHSCELVAVVQLQFISLLASTLFIRGFPTGEHQSFFLFPLTLSLGETHSHPVLHVRIVRPKNSKKNQKYWHVNVSVCNHTHKNQLYPV